MASVVNILLLSAIYLEHSEASVEVVSKRVSLKRCTVCEVQRTWALRARAAHESPRQAVCWAVAHLQPEPTG